MTWELWDSTGCVRRGIDTDEARNLVYANADSTVYAKNTQTGATITWDDVKDTEPAGDA